MTRDLRLSIDQIRDLFNLLGPMDEIVVSPDAAQELREMLAMALFEDSDVLNDFTA